MGDHLSALRANRRVITGSWASYTTIRYIIAYVVYSDRTRRAVALSLGISSVLSLLVAGALALSLLIPRPTNHFRPISRSLGKSLRHVAQFLVSFFLFVPAAVNLALIFAWRNTHSEFSLRGRCHWNLDVVWVGVGGQCVHAPAWGVWLAAAISRFVLTVAILVRDLLSERLCIHICGFLRSRIISPREPIACHDGSTIARRMAKEETISLEQLLATYLLFLHPFCVLLSKRAGDFQAFRKDHYPTVGWRQYPSLTRAGIKFHRVTSTSMPGLIPLTVPRYLRTIRPPDRSSRALPRPRHCDTRKAHENCTWAKVLPGMPHSHPMPGKGSSRGSPIVSAP